MGKGMFHSSGESVHRNGLSVLSRMDRCLCRLHDPVSFESRDFYHPAAQLSRKFCRVDLIAVFLHYIHHVNSGNYRNTKLGELSGQIQISL